MGYYKFHVFMCTNKRPQGEICCAAYGADILRSYARDRIEKLGISKPGQARINSVGCLGRCDQGPAMVVYPNETWYSFIDTEDVDEIIDSHLIHGQVVERLKIK